MTTNINPPCLLCGLRWPECGCTKEKRPLTPGEKAIAGTKTALENFYRNQIPKPKRRNSRPEKEVEHACIEWMRAMKWDVQVYEAKSTYDPKSRRYVGRTMKPGTVDCQGVMPSGRFVAVEFKAKGMLRTFNSPRNMRQAGYLIEKINNNAFGVVVDSVERLKELYHGYMNALSYGDEAAKQYLFESLPVKKKFVVL